MPSAALPGQNYFSKNSVQKQEQSNLLRHREKNNSKKLLAFLGLIN
jgi:hypothetical protein